MSGKNPLTKYLDNIYVVLVEPRNPGNIGSVVRAMKNMGISHLRLVNPVEYRNSPEQRKLGYRAQDITQNSKEFDTLEEAVKDMHLVFVATAKDGKWKKDFITPEVAGEKAAEQAHKAKIAFVFGREDSGITIDECQESNFYITIPMAGSYPSLNLSQAVLVCLYEVFKQMGTHPPIRHPKSAERKEFTRLFDNIWLLAKQLILREPEKGLFHRSLRRSLNRTRWTKADIAVFDRVCKQVRWFVNNKTKEDFKEDPDS